MQIPNVLKGENKNSMGAALAILAPSIDAPSATQKHRGLSRQTVPPKYSTLRDPLLMLFGLDIAENVNPVLMNSTGCMVDFLVEW